MAYSLRIGVLSGALLSSAGLALWALQGFTASDANPGSNVAKLVASSFAGNVTGVVYLGVLLLIATPIFRVAVSAFYFGMEKDGKYVGVTLAVLSMLIFALFSGAII